MILETVLNFNHYEQIGIIKSGYLNTKLKDESKNSKLEKFI